MEAPQAHCNFCGKHLVMGEILYTPDARVACVDCNAKVELTTADMSVGHNIRNTSIYALCAAALSLVVTFFPFSMFRVMAAVLAVSSIGAGIYAMMAANRKGDERFTRHIEQDKGVIYACSIIGIVLAALVTLLLVVAFVAWLGRPAMEEYRYDGYY
jgi:hypothetical protein